MKIYVFWYKFRRQNNITDIVPGGQYNARSSLLVSSLDHLHNENTGSPTANAQRRFTFAMPHLASQVLTETIQKTVIVRLAIKYQLPVHHNNKVHWEVQAEGKNCSIHWIPDTKVVEYKLKKLHGPNRSFPVAFHPRSPRGRSRDEDKEMSSPSGSKCSNICNQKSVVFLASWNWSATELLSNLFE